MSLCIFCKVIHKEIPAKIICEDDDTLAFYDVNPQAPIHALVITKEHYDNVSSINKPKLLSKLMMTTQKIAEELDLVEKGFRVVINTNKDGGQSVDHVHIHILGGRQMGWPPG